MKRISSIFRFCIYAFSIISFMPMVMTSVITQASNRVEKIDDAKTQSNAEIQKIDLTMPLPMLPELVFGTNNAPSMVIVYLSFTCEYCGDFFTKELPILKKLADAGEIKICIRPYIDTPISHETTAIIKFLCGDSQERLEKLFSLAFANQKTLIKITTIDDLHNFLKKILPDENITRESIIAFRENQNGNCKRKFQ